MSDELERRFDGAEVLQRLLATSGTLAEVEEVAHAFRAAAKEGVPPQVVIQALWEDEPRFASPDEARTLFANLLGLYDLVASGASLDLGAAAPTPKREKAPLPPPFGEDGPDEAFVEAAWRYLADHGKEREKLAHQFDHREDGLVAWLETQGLADDAFALAHQLIGDAFALLELGGHHCARVAEPRGGVVPDALGAWLEEGLFEAEHHEEAPLPEAAAAQLRGVVRQAVGALWMHRG